MREFLSKFAFDPNLRRAVGVEREFFLAEPWGNPMPVARKFLTDVNDPAWTYELSACQVEHRTRPHKSSRLIKADLDFGTAQGKAVTVIVPRLVALEVGPEDMPLDVYPDPRYLEIAKSIPRETLLAACRVTGTHIHIGVGSIEEAVDYHNRLRERLEDFCRLGDHSAGERLRIYKIMAKDWMPPRYDSVEHFHETARAGGFEENPRNCWHLIRISRHGTVELRMFGMTADNDEIVHWAEAALHYVL